MGSVLVMIASLLRWHDPDAVYLLIGGALSGGQLIGDVGVQRAKERSAGIGRTGKPRRRQLMDPLPLEVDSLEPRSGGSGTCRSGFV